MRVEFQATSFVLFCSEYWGTSGKQNYFFWFGGVLTGAGPSLRYCYRIIDQLDLTSQADPGDHSQATSLPHQPFGGPFSWLILGLPSPPPTGGPFSRTCLTIVASRGPSHDFPQAAGDIFELNMYNLSIIPNSRARQPSGLYELCTATGGNRTRDHLDQDSATWVGQYLSMCPAAGVRLRSY